jgi:small subunit ribosomal protein S6
MRRRMATEPPIYDLTLLLDTALDDDRRLTILANVEDSIDRAGEIVSRHDWGVRTTAYEVHKKTDADYHLLQFRGPRELLEQLEHNLKITDGVLRFRIVTSQHDFRASHAPLRHEIVPICGEGGGDDLTHP